MSKRFKQSSGRFAQFGGPNFSVNPYAATSQPNKLEISTNDIEILNQAIQNNVYIKQIYNLSIQLIKLTASVKILQHSLIKIKTVLEPIIANSDRLAIIRDALIANKNKLQMLAEKNPKVIKPIFENLGLIRNNIPPLIKAFKALNVFFILQSLTEIKNNLELLQNLKTKNNKSDEFETNEEKIKKLNSDNIYLSIQIANSIASFVPIALPVTATIDALLFVFSPDNLENLGFYLSGFHGGKEEAKKVWQLSTSKARASDVKKIIQDTTKPNKLFELKKILDKTSELINDPKIKDLVERTILNLIFEFEDKNFMDVRFFTIDNFIALLNYKKTDLNTHNYFRNWLRQPGNLIILNEIILVLKTYWSLTKNVKTKQDRINEINKRINELDRAYKTSNPVAQKFYDNEINKLFDELDKLERNK